MHKSCGSSYTNKKLIYKHNKTKCVGTPSRKRNVRIAREPYDSTKDCLFCGNKVETSKVNYFNTPNGDDEEIEKRAIIEDAAKLIKSDIKTIITPSVEEYPKSNDVTLECALEYVPAGLRSLLQHLLVGKDTRKEEASIGHTIVQGVRPGAVLAPLEIGLAIQMHHHFRSKFLIDILSAMGYCSSYSEV